MMNSAAYILLRALIMLANVYTYVILACALLSWFVQPFNRFYQFLRSVCEPVVAPFRRLSARLIPSNVPLDIAPLLAYFALQIAIALLRRLMYMML